MSTRKKSKGNQSTLQEDTPATSQHHPLDTESTPLNTEQPVRAVSSTAAPISPDRDNRSSISVGPLTSPSTSRKRTWDAMCEADVLYSSDTRVKLTGEPSERRSLSYPAIFKNRCPMRSRTRTSAKSRFDDDIDDDDDEKEDTMIGILTTAAATRLEKTVDQLKLDIPTQTLNFDPVNVCPVVRSDASKEKTPQASPSSSTISHLSSTLRSIDDSDDDFVSKQTNLRTVRDLPSVDIAVNKQDMTSIVLRDESSEASDTSTKAQSPFTQPKKELNPAKTAEFLQGRSFYGDTELSRMVGDLRKQMAAKGLCVFDRFLGDEKGKMVLNDVLKIYEKGDFVKGQLEPSPNPSSSSSSRRVIRGDIIRWLEGNENGCNNIKYLMERIDAAVMTCGEPFGGYTIKQRTRAMVACYPGDGAQYLKHIDNPCRNGRVLTCIYYLNIDWDIRRDGGLLRIYPEGSHEVANIEPLFDRLIFFWSDSRNPHEVKPAYRPRFAITLWYYDEKEQIEWLERRNSEFPSLKNPG